MKYGILLALLSLCGSASAIEVLVPRGNAGPWKYRDEGPLKGADWTGEDFDDGAWKEGPAPLGYGDEGLATTLSFGDDARSKHLASYFRRSFDCAEEKVADVTLEVLLRCDDGGVVYLNGTEIARANMPAGPVTGNTSAEIARSGAAETRFEGFLVPGAGVLKAGRNVLAVEIHQASGESSDLAFDLELKLYAKGEAPKIDHYAKGVEAFRRNDLEAGARHFSALAPGDPHYADALLQLVETVYVPDGLDQPEKALALAAKGYEALPGDMEIVRAFVRSHVLAQKDLMSPLQKRDLPAEGPAEFDFLRTPAPDLGSESPPLDADAVAEDLDYLELMIDNCYAYAERRGVDWKTALDVVRASFGGKGCSLAELAFRLERFMSLFGDPHSAIRVPAAYYLPGGFAPFLALRDGERVFLVEPGRRRFLEAGHPYLKAIDGEPLAKWLEAASHRVPRSSPQYQARGLAEALSHLGWLRTELELPASDTATLTLEDATAKSEATLKVKLRSQPPGIDEVLDDESRLLDDIGYLRISSMRGEAGFLDALDGWMAKFKDTRGMVIDVRGNSGGTQDCLKTLLPYFMEPDAPLRVVNVAAYRLPIRLPQPNPSGFLGLYGRGLHPLASSVWKPDEKAAIRDFLASFDPQWKLPEGKFSEWHAMGIRPSTNPKAFHYAKPAIILCDAGCFSATDNFLGGFKGLPGVTLMGSTSGGGSGRMQGYTLPNSGLPLVLCQMASFQRNGKTYDGHGVEPDVEIQPKIEDALKDHGDSVLEAALARLRK